MNQRDDGRYLLVKLLVATSIGVISSAAAAALHFHKRKSKSLPKNHHLNDVLVPFLKRTESGRAGNLERFSDYVARQIGFKDGSECPQLSKLVYDYLKRSKGWDEKLFEYFANELDPGSLYVKLVEELERCILGYFAFSWSQAPLMISQVLSVESEKKKLKDLVMAATREQRFERISKDLKVTRVFSTLLEEMKAIGAAPNGEPKCTEVMAPVALCDRSPVLLFMGGGMGAGKSTVLKQILKESFWSGAAANAVVVEADAFKETDVLYRALSSKGHHSDMLQTAELVHQSSTDAASSLLVTALNEGRDVIMDGTLSWVPFVEQTITMARDVHKNRYRMGVGYHVADDGTVTENYWDKIDGEEVPLRKPYRIELVGVICDPYLAVVRGIRRAIQTGRAVRVKGQLKSHKRFAHAFRQYCPLVDNARLYCTNAIAEPPKLIAWKDGGSNTLVDPEEINCLNVVSHMNDEAESIYELYQEPADLIYQPGAIWNDVVLLPTRPTLQKELKAAIARIENPTS